MGTVSLQNIIDRARSRADMPLTSDPFVTDSEATVWANEAVGQLHEMLVNAYAEQYASSESTLTTVAGQTDYALPATFFKLYGVELSFGGRTRSLRRYQTSERNLYRNQSWNQQLPLPRYSLVGNTLRLLPAPPAASGKVLFAPVAPTLSLPADTVTFPGSWERFVVLNVAKQMLAKEESDTREARADIEQMREELKQMAADRDLAAPSQTVDVEMLDPEDLWWP